LRGLHREFGCFVYLMGLNFQFEIPLAIWNLSEPAQEMAGCGQGICRCQEPGHLEGGRLCEVDVVRGKGYLNPLKRERRNELRGRGPRTLEREPVRWMSRRGDVVCAVLPNVSKIRVSRRFALDDGLTAVINSLGVGR